MAQWYYSKNGEQQGPVSSTQLKQLAIDSQLQPTDLVWKEGMKQWVAASSIKGLFVTPKAPSEPPSPPPVPPTETATSASTAPRPSSFGEWYKTTWLGRMPLAVQAIVWLFYGFLWIPYWYFWKVAPSGKAKEKLAALKIGRKLLYGVLAMFFCFLLIQAATHRLATTARPVSPPAVSTSPVSTPVVASTAAKPTTPANDSVPQSMADGPVPLKETLRRQFWVKPFTSEQGIDPAVTSWNSLAATKLRITCASTECNGSFDPDHKVYDAFVHTTDGKIVLVQFSGDYAPGTGHLSEKDRRTITTLFGNVVGMFPNNTDADFSAVRKLVFGDVASLASTGVRKNVGQAVIIAALAKGKLTITVAVNPEHTKGVLTNEMLDQVVHQDFRVFRQ